MLRHPSLRLTARLLAATLGPLSATGCAALVPFPPSAAPPTVEASSAVYRHEVRFDTDEAEPSPPELARLNTFLATLPPGATPHFRLLGHADERADDIYNLRLSAERARNVASYIRHRLGPAAELTTSALGEKAPLAPGSGERAWSHNRSVEVMATTYLVQLPACPDWSRDPAYDPRNLPLSNLGCANAVNLGLMIADPADLARGRHLGPADGVREAEAIVRYRTDKVKALHQETVSQ